MRIFFVGHAETASSTRHRADALHRLGHHVTLVDPYRELALPIGGSWRGRLHFHTGYRFAQGTVRAWCESQVAQQEHAAHELVWIDHGELFGRSALATLRRLNAPVIVHNVDDPTGPRDGRRFDSLRAALPFYDACFVVKECSKPEFLALGARAVHRVWMCYDEVRHAPFEDESQIPAHFRSDVAFVGTWMRGEGRDQFMWDLIRQGIDVAIWGNRWPRSPLWKHLKPHWRGPALTGRDYVAALQGAKIALGLLSHCNRDLHTARTMEIPYANGLLCAERTSEHQLTYDEGRDAMFWNDAAECAQVCRRLLDDASLRASIRKNGAERIRKSRRGNEDLCADILTHLAGMLPTR